MKKPLIAVLMIALLSLSLLAGCAASAAEQPHTPTHPVIGPTEARKEPRPTDAPVRKQEEVPTSTDPQQIGKDAAMDIALADAGFSRDQVTGLRAEFDYDDGVPEYDVEFRSGGYEYDYEIHAKTGAIRSRDRDREHD